jgi:hypothetical protein
LHTIKWALTREALSQFSRLDGDPDKAGEKYEAIRLRLAKFFDWRGAHFPDQLADETINRVIRKVESGETAGDRTILLGVARLVFLESLRAPGFPSTWSGGGNTALHPRKLQTRLVSKMNVLAAAWVNCRSRAVN